MRICAKAVVIAAVVLVALSACAQDPSTGYGIVPFGTYLGGNENINVQTGNMHIQIPLLNLPGRNGFEQPLVLSFNSQNWYVDFGQPDYNGQYHPNWKTVVYPGSVNAAPWFADGYGGASDPNSYDTNVLSGTYGNSNILCNGNYRITQPDGRKVYFPNIRTNCMLSGGTYGGQAWPQAEVNQASNPVVCNPLCNTDLFTYNVPNSGVSTLHLTNGETVQFTSSGLVLEDANGNIINTGVSSSSDTLGRPTGGLTYLDSNGNQQTIQLVHTNMPIAPNMPQYGTVNSPAPGTWSPLTAIIMPNGDRWDMQYDTNGALSRITYPSGGFTTYQYQWFVFGNNPAQLEIVSKQVCRDTNGRSETNCSVTPDTTTISPVLSYPSNSSSTVIGPTGDKTAYTFMVGNPPVNKVQIYSGTSTLLRTIDTTMGSVGPSQQVTTLNDTPGTPFVSKVTWTRTSTGTSYNGNTGGPVTLPYVTSETVYDWGVGSPRGAVRTTNTSYLQTYTALPIYITGRKASEQVLDSGGNTVAQTTYEYDNYSSGITASGAIQHDSARGTSYTTRANLTKVSRWLNTTNTWLNTINTYDDAGNILTTKDPNLNLTTFSYADNFTDGVNRNTKAFVTQVTLPTTNGVSHISKKQYYFNTSLVAAICGENFTGTCINNLNPTPTSPQPDYATTTYDALGRPLIATAGDGGQTTISYSDDQPSPPVQFSTTTSTLIVSGTSKTSAAFMDGIGNVIQTQLTSDPEGTDYVDTTYDAAGRKKTVSNPHRSATLPTDGITTYTNYDGLGRVTSVLEPDGSTVSTAYAGNTVTVTDEVGNQRKSVSDALGRLIEVDEPATVAQGTDGTDQITINGYEQSTVVTYQCGQNQTCTRTQYDDGSVGISMGGFTATANYGPDSPGACPDSVCLAARLAEGLSANGSPVTAYAIGSVIYVASQPTGAASNYSVSMSSTWLTGYFAQPSFTATATTPTLTGGTNPGSGGSTPSLSNPFVTIYAYDTLNNLARAEQHGTAPTDMSQWRIRTFTYDSLSRLLCGSNPEIQSVTCPSSGGGSFPAGAVTYTYDSDGNALTKKTPAPNQTSASTTETVTYSYDALNRLTQKSFSAITPLATPAIKYGYDGVAPSGCTPPSLTDSYPKGRRTSMCDASGSTSWKHDVLGRIASESRTISGHNNVTSYTYNLDGSLNKLTYPSGRAISYGYSTAGRALSAVDQSNSINYAVGTSSNPAGASYTPAGALTGMQNGASITVSNSYNSRQQPTILSAGTTAATILSLSYDFHASTHADNGNVFQIVNNRDSNRTQNFTYDALNRIAAGYTSGTNWGEQFTIDAWGNLTNKSAYTGKTNYESLSASATTQNRLTGYGYDAAGNMTQNGTPQYFYDAENHMTSASGGYSYIYDGDGNRVEKCTAGTTAGTCASGATGTLYWMDTGGNNIAESDLTGAMQEEYVFFGKRIARRDVSSGNVHYYFSDFLGSTDLVTDAVGTMPPQKESDYYPYGGEIAVSGSDTNHYKFTGKERDAESGLDDFVARYYTSALGRFVIPDWSAGEDPVPYAQLDSPQTLNLYGYVMNNPVSKTDPVGHAGESAVLEAPEAAEAITVAEEGAEVGAEAGEGCGPACVAVGAGVGAAVGVGVYEGKKHFGDPGAPPKPPTPKPPANATEKTKDEPEAQASSGGARQGGGRNERKINENREKTAKDKVEDLRTKRDELRSKANKTKEDKAELQKVDKQLNRQLDRLKKSETHSRRGKDQSGD